MRIFVRSVEGQTSALEVDGQAEVQAVKATIASLSGVPAEEQVLSYGGTILDSAARLADCGVEDEATLFVSLELQGGGKKRKKKTYTKPKKIKHKRKKVKLAVLKFYKVDSNDKVTRLRRECPHETCGPGVFMAMHFNRYYCGKCHLTYLIKKDLPPQLKAFKTSSVNF
ncbi:ubl-1 [Symbiodinium sp. CCMP2456]|nr:ubl-1 [Symbiodinium sp. CCMP2456]